MMKFIFSDNLQAMNELYLDGYRFDLVYCDPPFNTGRDFVLEETGELVYCDKWKSLDIFTSTLKDRCTIIHDLLKSTGCLALHCDVKTSHYNKIMLDDIFGRQNFVNEIIWQRTVAKGNATKKFSEVHDCIFIYKKSNDFSLRYIGSIPNDRYYKKFNLNDNDGRGYYRLAPLDNPAIRPNLMYSYKNYQSPKKGWRITKDVMEKLDNDCRLHFPKNINGRIARKHYLDEQKLPPFSDVWTDILPVQNNSNENCGYPTQKPEKLLERIITACTDTGNLILDPYAGSGTSGLVAKKMSRDWIGIDASVVSNRFVTQRLSL